MNGTHVVIKAFDGAPGVRYVPGQVVDATAWPRVDSLLASRYIRVRGVAEAAQDKQPAAGKRGKG